MEKNLTRNGDRQKMVKSSYTKPKSFRGVKPAFYVWADKVYIKNNEICLYFNSAMVHRFVVVPVYLLGDFVQARERIKSLYRQSTSEDEKTIKAYTDRIVGELFRLGLIGGD